MNKITPIAKFIAPRLKKYSAPACRTGTAEELEIKLDSVIASGYSKYLRTGCLINSGTYADVYELRGWKDSYVVRVLRGKENSHKLPKFDTVKFQPADNDSQNILYKTENNSMSILKRINGTPLHGRFWNLDRPAGKKNFYKYFDEIMNLPDEYFSKYMDDLIEIRKSGYNIDGFNPNNFLLDKQNQRINIIDLTKNYSNLDSVYMKDFYPFFDSKRIMFVISKTTLEERNKLADDIHNFFDRMVRIAKQKGIKLKIKRNEKSWLEGDFVNALYYKEPLLFQLWLN